MIENNISKRLQPKTHTKIKGDFVFLPMQYMNDASIKEFGSSTYPKFVNRVGKFCAGNKLILAIKRHPHAYRKEPKSVQALFRRMKNKYGKYFQPVDGSIHWFCQNCRIMAGMNTGSFSDGLINKSVMSHCGQSIFMKTGAVIHDNKVTSGLQKCLEITNAERSIMKVRQNALLYYLYNRYLILKEDAHHSEWSNEEKIDIQLREHV